MCFLVVFLRYRTIFAIDQAGKMSIPVQCESRDEVFSHVAKRSIAMEQQRGEVVLKRSAKPDLPARPRKYHDWNRGC